MMTRSSAGWLAFVLMALVVVTRAQQPLPVGLPVPPLAAGPFVFQTAEHQTIRVSVVARGLSHPWAIAFMPDGGMLITERAGRLRVVRDGVLEPAPIGGVPRVRTDGNGGLMDVALHPRFAENHLIYLTYTKPVENGRGTPSLARGRLENGSLIDVQDLIVPEAYDGNSGLNGRLAFGRDGMIYMSTGGNISKVAQDPMSLRGKILRLRDDGTITAGQSVRRPARIPARDLHARPSQHARAHRPPLYRRRVEQRERTEWRRRNQRHLAGPQLRLADRELRA